MVAMRMEDETFAGEDGYYSPSLDLCCWLFSTRSCLFKGRNTNISITKATIEERKYSLFHFVI